MKMVGQRFVFWATFSEKLIKRRNHHAMLVHNALTDFRKQKEFISKEFSFTNTVPYQCRGSSAWESARRSYIFVAEGEAEDRVVAGSNPALGTIY